MAILFRIVERFNNLGDGIIPSPSFWVEGCKLRNLIILYIGYLLYRCMHPFLEMGGILCTLGFSVRRAVSGAELYLE